MKVFFVNISCRVGKNIEHWAEVKLGTMRVDAAIENFQILQRKFRKEDGWALELCSRTETAHTLYSDNLGINNLKEYGHDKYVR